MFSRKYFFEENFPTWLKALRFSLRLQRQDLHRLYNRPLFQWSWMVRHWGRRQRSGRCSSMGWLWQIKLEVFRWNPNSNSSKLCRMNRIRPKHLIKLIYISSVQREQDHQHHNFHPQVVSKFLPNFCKTKLHLAQTKVSHQDWDSQEVEIHPKGHPKAHLKVSSGIRLQLEGFRFLKYQDLEEVRKNCWFC